MFIPTYEKRPCSSRPMWNADLSTGMTLVTKCSEPAPDNHPHGMPVLLSPQTAPFANRTLQDQPVTFYHHCSAWVLWPCCTNRGKRLQVHTHISLVSTMHCLRLLLVEMSLESSIPWKNADLISIEFTFQKILFWQITANSSLSDSDAHVGKSFYVIHEYWLFQNISPQGELWASALVLPHSVRRSLTCDMSKASFWPSLLFCLDTARCSSFYIALLLFLLCLKLWQCALYHHLCL